MTNKITFLGMFLILFSVVSVSALNISIISPVGGASYSQNVPVGLTTDVSAKCSYNFWAPYNSGSENSNGDMGVGLDLWFGTSYHPITSIFVLEHTTTIDIGNYSYLGFECVDENNVSKTLDKVYVNITLKPEENQQNTTNQTNTPSETVNSSSTSSGRHSSSSSSGKGTEVYTQVKDEISESRRENS